MQVQDESMKKDQEISFQKVLLQTLYKVYIVLKMSASARLPFFAGRTSPALSSGGCHRCRPLLWRLDK